MSSCKDITPDNNKNKSYFSINDGLFTITQGGLVNLGSASDESQYPGFMHVVLFTTDGINFSEDSTGELLLKREGALLGIVVFNGTEGILDSGDYYINLRPPYMIHDIGVGFYSLDFKEENVSGPYFEYERVALLSGEMSIKNNPKEKEVILELISEDGNQITSNYYGELQALQSSVKPSYFN